MNVKLLKNVRDYIAKHPEKYNQRQWCGSACCVGGTTCFVAGRVTRRALTAANPEDFPWHQMVGDVHIEMTAQGLLGLDDDQAGRLFQATWNSVAAGQFRVDHSTMTPKERSVVAVKRINHFLKTKGAE